MAVPEKLTVTLSAVTPLFIGGADPNVGAELRPPTMKGLLRYWYRAIDPKYAQKEAYRHNDPQAVASREELLFGSTEVGQSPCLLRVALPSANGGQHAGWAPTRQEGWSRQIPNSPLATQAGFEPPPINKDLPKNGFNYLGYTLALGTNRRRAIPAGQGFTLTLLHQPGATRQQQIRQAWLAGLWLLIHIGGVGSRSRRGFGSLCISGWTGWQECEELPLACLVANALAWEEGLKKGFATLRKWFPASATSPITHTTLVPGQTRFVLLDHPHDTWQKALDEAGYHLQCFRQRRPPDHDLIADHLTGTRRLERDSAGPQRAEFGLPLTFQFSRDNRTLRLTIQGEEHERMASPLFVRILRLGQAYYPLYVYVPSPHLAPGEKLSIPQGRGNGLRLGWPQQDASAVALFLEDVQKKYEASVRAVTL